ncbi:MAG: radical SAM protein [Deltaproteobacteria bacterium]|nr:radical SAM protein [Deltaproteobacteria bacterium]
MNYKTSLAVELICKQYCSYYKEDQDEELFCQGFKVIQDFIERNRESTAFLHSENEKNFTDQFHHLLHHTLCQHCDFLIDGCDFKDPKYTGRPAPCGGYIATDVLLERLFITDNQLLKSLISKETHAALAPNCVLRHLERPYVYDIRSDELYELDKGGLEFLARCDGTSLLSELPADKAFLETCLKEGLLSLGPRKSGRHFHLRPSPVPSLRYLELQLTSRCNLKCKHCYLGESTLVDLPFSDVLSVLEEFEQMQGLRVLFSGGEPLLYPDLRALINALPRFSVRKVLLTNGTLIRKQDVSMLSHFDEIQFSLDGLKGGHEALRGPWTFDQTVRGIEIVRENGIPISIATMVHRHNLKEFDGLAKWIEGLEPTEWNIDVPCATGRLSENPEFWVTPEEGAPFLRYATGGSYHGTDEPFACGYHLCTVTAEGDVLKCGFYTEEPLGSLQDGLEVAWKQSKPLPISQLECDPCPSLSDCKGGCRFRALSLKGKDPVMCALYGHKATQT